VFYLYTAIPPPPVFYLKYWTVSPSHTNYGDSQVRAIPLWLNFSSTFNIVEFNSTCKKKACSISVSNNYLFVQETGTCSKENSMTNLSLNHLLKDN